MNSRFIVYCEDHRGEAKEEEKEEELEVVEGEEGVEHYICSICKSGLDEAHILICESCDRGFHSNCHVPRVDMEELEGMGEDEGWFCATCSLD